MKKRFIKPIILAAFIGVAIYLGKYTDANNYLNTEYLSNLISSFGMYGPLAFIIIYIIGTILLLPGTPITILGGILFGSILGTFYTVIGATIGAFMVFLMARFFGKDFVDRMIKNKFKGLDKYDNKLSEKGLLTVLFLRLVPLFPFNGLNFGLGLTRVKSKDYLIATFIGIIPGSFILSNIGSNANDLTNPKLYLFIGLFILLMFVPFIYKKIKVK